MNPTLKRLAAKYHTTDSGTNAQLALRIWKVRGISMPSRDINIILPLLPPDERTKANALIKVRITTLITDYNGLWRKKPKPVGQMTRQEVIKHLKSFRDAWQRYGGQQDIDDERIKREPTKILRGILNLYYSNTSKLMAEQFLR